MIELDMEQGTQEWLDARLGLATASEFHKVMTCMNKPNVLPAGAMTYMNDLITEIMTGESKGFTSKYTDHGIEYEPQARDIYEIDHDVTVRPVGLCINNNNLWGYSPDGLVGDSGLIEIKCPYNITNHIDAILNGMHKKHLPQVQGGLMITGRQWCDFVSYAPALPTQPIEIRRIERDEEYICKLKKRLTLFSTTMIKILKEKFNKGWPIDGDV